MTSGGSGWGSVGINVYGRRFWPSKGKDRMSNNNHSDNETDESVGKRKPRSKEIFSPELLDQLLKNYSKPEDLTGPEGLLKRLTGALVERAMGAELTHHLGYEPGEKPPEEQGNRRNGTNPKTLRTERGSLTVEVPRDRQGSFEPQIVPKHQRHFNGFDDKILSMYARGMSVRDIRAHLEEIYGVSVDADLISRVTDAVVEELKAWQNRPLEALYLVVYLDALVVKIRDQGVVQNRAVYLAVGVGLDGSKDVLGMWIQQTEGAKFWMNILTELRNRGVQDVLVLCADGLTGLPSAVEAIFPQTVFQTCLVHMVRSSTKYVGWKERKAVCADLRAIYTAANRAAAELALEQFESRWNKRYPTIGLAWRKRWQEIVPFLDFPPEIRRAIYTTNAIEALNRQLRKVLKTRGHLPSDDAAFKLIFLALRNAKKTWGHPFPQWKRSLAQFAIHFEGRFPL
jgi:putative transposase